MRGIVTIMKHSIQDHFSHKHKGHSINKKAQNKIQQINLAILGHAVTADLYIIGLTNAQMPLPLYPNKTTITLATTDLNSNLDKAINLEQVTNTNKGNHISQEIQINITINLSNYD